MAVAELSTGPSGSPLRRTGSGDLRIVAARTPDSEVVSAALAVPVGSRNETAAWSGLAHLAEHVACGADSAAARRLAAVGGVCNAVTQPDLTLYHGTVLAEHGELLLDRLLEILDTDGADTDRIAAEVQIVTGEITAAMDGAVMGGFPWLWLPGVLYDDPVLAHNGYGDLRSLRRVTPTVLSEFFARHYRSDQAVFAVAAADLVGPLTRLAATDHTPADTGRVASTPVTTPAPVRRLSAPEQPHQATALAWSMPYQPLSPGHFAATVLADVLVGPYDGLLDDAMADAFDVAAYVGPFADPWGVSAPLPFVVEVHHDAESDSSREVAEVCRVVREAVDGTGPDVVTPAARRLATQWRERWADPVEWPHLAATAELVYGNADRAGGIPDGLAAVTTSAVRAVTTTLGEHPYRVLSRGPRR
ncbi:M16 family metallopeptidase [Micromonospora sp. LOL_021]|uniref:M16 family metallopeptidase n=1 Tax=Micromonospora sp. LOL_021 TaxID=3345417 RepID=UPI003A8B64AD